MVEKSEEKFWEDFYDILHYKGITENQFLICMTNYSTDVQRIEFLRFLSDKLDAENLSEYFNPYYEVVFDNEIDVGLDGIPKDQAKLRSLINWSEEKFKELVNLGTSIPKRIESIKSKKGRKNSDRIEIIEIHRKFDEKQIQLIISELHRLLFENAFIDCDFSQFNSHFQLHNKKQTCIDWKVSQITLVLLFEGLQYNEIIVTNTLFKLLAEHFTVNGKVLDNENLGSASSQTMERKIRKSAEINLIISKIEKLVVL